MPKKMKLAISLILTLNLGLAGFVLISEAGTNSSAAQLVSTHDFTPTSQQSAGFHSDYTPVFDTVWVLGSAFVLVDLEAQYLHLHRRGIDTVMSLPVSSGNPRIHDGMDTPTGIYSVQTKAPLAISRQYDNAKMFHWIGFNYNIGAHGLVGNSYYRHLGVRRSSHGCLRMGREAIEELYPLVPYGTPVMVYETRPARTFAFADTLRFAREQAVRLTSMSKPVKQLLEARLERLYAGRAHVDYLPDVYLDGRTQLRPGGYAVGFQDSVVVQESAIVVNTLHSHHTFMGDRLDWQPAYLYDSVSRGLHVAVRFRSSDSPAPSLSTTRNLAL